MKTLILVRHAKSDWPQDVPDFDRPLNERGHRDAPRMAKYIMAQGVNIQSFISSPAKRALTTCRYFAETYGNSSIKKEENLYEPHPEDFVKTVQNVSDEFDSVALFSHNGGISDFATSLSGEPIVFPTCGVVVFEMYCEQWSQFEGADKKLVQFFKPKEI